MINLLPPEYKKELKAKECLRIALILGTIFLFFLLSLVLTLFVVKTDIKGKAESLEILLAAQEDRLVVSETQELRSRIAASNKMISELESFYKTQIDSIEALERIFQSLPPEVNLTSLSWQKESGNVAISGFSPSREILFALKNNLEKREEFNEIYFPPQNWIKPTDIDFQVTFKIKTP